MTASTSRLPAAIALIVVSALSIGVRAQSPEQKPLEYLVGKWTIAGETKATASAPASKASGSETCEWFARAHVVCRAELSGPAGLYTSMRTISYVPALKQYSSYTVDSLGYAVLSLGEIKGNTWTFTTDLGTMKTRATMKTSGNSYAVTSEYAGADGKWITTSTATGTRGK